MHKLGDAISELLKHYRLDEAVRMHQALNHWREVVGPSIARNCRAREVRRGTLIVQARSAAWRNEIALQKDAILRALNDKLGNRLIKDLRFKL